LARVTAATRAFSLHATGMVLACATGARVAMPAATMVARSGAEQCCVS
jgi:hypothetical protein